MKSTNFNKSIITALLLAVITMVSCTKLDQHIYSVVPNDNFWQTPEQIAAGIAPAYQALTAIPGGNVFTMSELTTDEEIVPTRGADWYDNGEWQAIWTHNFTPNLGPVNSTWTDIYNGIGKINFTLSVVNGLTTKPDNLDAINAELKTLRAYYYYLAMDLFGNVPLVTDFNTDPGKVTNTDRKDVYAFVESELKDNVGLLSSTVDNSTYGRVTKYFSYCLLAKLYLNAQVYTGTTNWTACISYCDSVISSGQYSLSPNYFDNFSVKNDGSKENIFVVPFDNINIPGNGWETNTLHYQNNVNFQLTGSPNNGFSSNSTFYYSFDTTSIYTVKGDNTYRTFNDQRTGQFLVGQQFSLPFTYPPNADILYSSTDASLKLKDVQTGLLLAFNPVMTTLSDPGPAFRLAGVRSIKYFPEAGTAGNQSNDMVIFRLADIMLMKAEAELRAGTITDALDMVNAVRERAYGGDVSHDWTLVNLTLDNLLAERGRELAWESWRRNDMIRYEVASGTQYFGAARTPGKAADPTDGHLNILPIPQPQIISNPNLKQNPGYPN